jgi:hypothetical protein
LSITPPKYEAGMATAVEFGYRVGRVLKSHNQLEVMFSGNNIQVRSYEE